VTSGKHLDPLAQLVEQVLVDAGLPQSAIYKDRGVELPGYYRPEKKWDVETIHEGTVAVAVEFKSILGSYGNNMNNRVEEALGNATDLLEAAEKGLLGVKPPWLGYVFLMQDEPASRSTVRVRQTHFPVDPQFSNSSYQDRAFAHVPSPRAEATVQRGMVHHWRRRRYPGGSPGTCSRPLVGEVRGCTTRACRGVARVDLRATRQLDPRGVLLVTMRWPAVRI